MKQLGLDAPNDNTCPQKTEALTFFQNTLKVRTSERNEKIKRKNRNRKSPKPSFE